MRRATKRTTTKRRSAKHRPVKHRSAKRGSTKRKSANRRAKTRRAPGGSTSTRWTGDVDRGQSIALDYTLALGIGFLLVTGLLVAGGDFVTDQRDRATQAELRVVGQQVAGDVAAVDRLAQAVEGDGSVHIERRIPGDVAGSMYRIRVVADEDPSLHLRSVGSPITVTVALTNRTSVVPGNVTGGSIVVNHTGSGDIRIEQGESHA